VIDHSFFAKHDPNLQSPVDEEIAIGAGALVKPFRTWGKDFSPKHTARFGSILELSVDTLQIACAWDVNLDE
jgi:hypothetical protein